MNLGQPKDIEVPQSPGDGISALSFSPQQDYLAASSWDNQTRIYEVQASGNAVGKASITHEGPALDVCWSTDGTKVFSAGADKAGRLMDLNTGQTTQVAGHDAPIKSCRWIDGLPNMSNMVVTGSWDKTARYWDLRSPTPAHTLQLPERCYSLDVKGPLMVIGTAERHVLIFNLNNPSTPYKQVESPLKWQTRTISCFINSTGYAVGSVEGRVGIQYVEDKDASQNFSFKCHRDDKLGVFPVNHITFHPQYGTFSTCGGDGNYFFWDKDSRQRLKASPSPVGTSISTCAFNRTGAIFAYAASYDWHKGHEHHQQTAKNTIFLQAVKDVDVKPRPKK
ncbi:WD40-repeat-containing domain protein [Gorgonomyces haynaldii]|nr:WD40-repeat-containing domain protein [Gorgonomyces haynaldii]